MVRLGAGQLALYKVAQKMHIFQFLEVGFPWSLECWAGEFLLQSFKSVLDSGWGAGSGHPPQPPLLRLHISGKVQCVPLQFCKGDGGVLQVVEEDLDLCHDIMGPDVCS